MAKPAAPFIAPTSGTLGQQMALVAQAINRKADSATGEPPTFHAVILVDASGQNWQVTVTTGGVLQTALVPRS